MICYVVVLCGAEVFGMGGAPGWRGALELLGWKRPWGKERLLKMAPE